MRLDATKPPLALRGTFLNLAYVRPPLTLKRNVGHTGTRCKGQGMSGSCMRCHLYLKIWEQGNEAFKAGDFPAAIGHYTAAVLADPRNPTYALNRAAAYLRLGKYVSYYVCLPQVELIGCEGTRTPNVTAT